MDWEINGLTGSEIYNTHADFKDEPKFLAALRSPLTMLTLMGAVKQYPQEVFGALMDYPADYLEMGDPDVAERFLTAFEAAIERLTQMPYLGVAQVSGNPALFGLRRWPIKGFEKYLIFYLVLEDIVDLVRVLHSSQDLKAILENEP